MYQWIPHIMVRVVVVFSLGILTGIYLPDCIPERSADLIFLLLLFTYGIVCWLMVRNYWRGSFAGCIGLMSIAFAGYLLVLQRTDFRKKNHYSHFTDPIESYVGIISSKEIKPHSTKVEIAVSEILVRRKWRSTFGKVLVYVAKNNDDLDITNGDRVMVNGTPAPVPIPTNPGEFNFRDFLKQQNISHQHRITQENIIVLSRGTDHGILYYSQLARNWAGSIITKFVKGEREQGITLALVLGVSEGIDNELQDAYSASGAMHVLSVSGLHVGIIYAIILLLMKPISSFAWSRWLIATISLSCLWAYAFVTGLPPSVLRAVMMFSFVVIGRPFGRNTNIYNTLAAAAFLLLIFNPFLILSVGFQLSYLAVLGIIYLQRPLYDLWEPTWIVWDKLWQITSVSIAAQLATYAVGFYYFHQFPVYFLISNLLVIPVSTAVLVAGVALLVVSPITWFAKGVAWIVQLLVKILNGCVFLIEDLPGSVIDGVQISVVQCWLLMLATVAMILLFQKRKLYWGVIAASLMLIFGSFQWSHFVNDVKRDQLVIYDITGHTAMERINNGKALLYSDSLLLNDHRQIRFHIQPNRTISGIKSVRTLCLNDQAGIHPGFKIFYWNNTSILFINQVKADLPESMVVDYLIVGNNSMPSLKLLEGRIQFKRLILTGSNGLRYTRNILDEAKARHIVVHAVREEGAFITNL